MVCQPAHPCRVAAPDGKVEDLFCDFCHALEQRALGFGATPVILSVLTESVALALLGGTIGGAISYAVFNGFTATTMNFQTFSQVTFAFAVTPRLMLQAIFWAAALGLLGGIFPAIRAARLPIAVGLRE